MKDVFQYSLMFIAGLSLGFCFGYMYGSTQMLNWGFDTAMKFIDVQELNVSVSYPLIRAGIAQYQGQITEWLDNAFIYNNSGN